MYGETVYFGSGDGSSSLLRKPMKMVAQRVGGKGVGHAVEKEYKDKKKKVSFKSRVYSLCKIIWAVTLASEKKGKFRDMAKARNNGMLVLTDRYPQTNMPGCSDGPLLHRYKAHVNKELIDEFHSMRFNFKVEFKWIKGHNGNSFNELADQLASEAKSEICGDIPECSMSINVKRHEDGFLIAYAIDLTTFGIYDIVDKNIIYSKDIKTEPRAMAQAILNGIKEIPEGSKVILYSDYSYSNYIFSKFSWDAKANEDIINKIHNYASRMHFVQCVRYKINILDTAINDMIDNYIPKARMCKRLIPKKQMTV